MAAPVLPDYAKEQRELAQVIATGCAVARLRVLARAGVNAAAVPALVLWLDSFTPLPAAAVWLALATWPMCVAVAVAGAALARAMRHELDSRRTAAGRLADVRFDFVATQPPLELLAATAGAVLWVHGIAPWLVDPARLAAAQAAWALLVAAVLAAQYRELPT